MRVEVEHLPQSQVQLQIEVDPEMLGQAVDKAYQRLSGKYRVPGFRPGKAPRAVLERAIGPDTLLSEATDICMNDAYAQAIKDNDLQPLGYPDVQSPKPDEVSPEKGLTFTATVYVRPQAQLGDYRSLRIAPRIAEITQDEVDRVLANAREEQTPWQPVEDQPAESGDLATLRILATIEDETLVDQDSWEYRLNAEESPDLPIPGLSQHIIGMVPGEIKDVTLDLPEDYTPDDYAGKQMQVHLELLRLDRKTPPVLDDDFARGLGKFESVDELRTALLQSLQTQALRQAMDNYAEDVLRQVVDQAAVEAPPPLVDQEVDEVMRQLQENVERERRISMDTYTRVVGKSIEELREESRPLAEQRVRTDLVLDAVAEREGIEVPAHEIEEQVRLVTSSPTLSNKERRRLLASDDLRQRLTRRLRRRHTIDRLMAITRPEEPAAAILEHETATEVEDAGEPREQPTEGVAPALATQTPSEPAVATGTHDSPSGQRNEQEN